MNTTHIKSDRCRRSSSARLMFAAIAAVLGAASAAQATILTFEGHGSNTQIPPSYASNVSAAGTGVSVANGATPNIGVVFTPTQDGNPGNGWHFYDVLPGDVDWKGVAQLDGNPPDEQFDVVFTPEAGFGVLVDSFEFDDYGEYAGGHTFNWELLDGNGTALFGQTGLMVEDNTYDSPPDNLLINTGMTQPHFGVLTLRITPTAGATDDRAIDNLSFTQAVPEPASLAMLALGGLTLLARRRA